MNLIKNILGSVDICICADCSCHSARMFRCSSPCVPYEHAALLAPHYAQKHIYTLDKCKCQQSPDLLHNPRESARRARAFASYALIHEEAESKAQRSIWGYARDLLILGIKGYQYIMSPVLGPPSCRFYPSCSQYGVLALQKYGAVHGSKKIIMRLCKCHPFHAGGIDFP